jgi:hypothetical protein
MPSRTPPAAVRRQLRREVNFGCPVRYSADTGCGCPILSYHHFDPPWEGHFLHEPDGMIALCPRHHTQADGGAWTAAQLRQMKREPFIDDLLKVPWPWRTEGLVVKIGPSLVLGSGSPLRLNENKLLGFRPVQIDQLGGNTISFDAKIPGTGGDIWLQIDDSWFEAQLNDVSDIEFAPQLRQFQARHRDGSTIRLRFFKVRHADFDDWFSSFLRRSPQQEAKTSLSEILEGCQKNLEEKGLIDSDGEIPIMSFEGAFQCPEVAIRVTGNRMFFRSFLPGDEDEFEWHTHIVDDQYRMIMRRAGGAEFFSLG